MGDGMPSRTIADVLGADVADELARWAIDALCEPPVRIETATTKIPTWLVEEGRAVLDRAGLDFRALKGTDVSGRSKRRQEAPR